MLQRNVVEMKLQIDQVQNANLTKISEVDNDRSEEVWLHVHVLYVQYYIEK